MLVPCPDASCGRRIGVNLGRAVNREEISGLQVLAQTCARCRVNGVSDCAAARAYAVLKAEALLKVKSRDFEEA